MNPPSNGTGIARPWRGDPLEEGGLPAGGQRTQPARTPKSRAPKPPRPSRPKTPPPDWALAGKPEQRGVRLVLWHLWIALRLYKLKWIPQPRPYGSYKKHADNVAKQQLGARSKTQAIIVVLTTKGGACKTTVTTWLGAIRATITQLVVIILDTDSGGGKVLRRFKQKADGAMNTAHVVARGGDITYEELTRAARTDPLTGAVLIHSDAGDKFPKGELGQSAHVLHSRAAHSLVTDTTPGLDKEDSEATLEANTDSVVDTADVFVLPGKITSDEEMKDILTTLDHPRYHLRENIERVVIAVCAVKWWRYNTRTQYEIARQYGVRPDQVVLIPWDRYQERVGPVDVGVLKNTKRNKMYFALVRLNQRVDETVRRTGRRNVAAVQADEQEVPDHVPAVA